MPLSLYVHIPFCRSRCAYCSFYSGEPLARLPEYPALLAAEARLRADQGHHGPASTLYFGGGTPSLLGEENLGALVEGLAGLFGLRPGAEVTVEVNPGASLSFSTLAAHGVTRVSLGVQALCDRRLALLGRGHGREEARQAIRRAVAAGLSVSADLIYGYEGLAPRDLVNDARALLDLGVRHLSAYSLEPGGGAAPPPPAHPDEEAAQWDALADFLGARGFAAYEVSNFAPPGSESRHNLSYWEGGKYLGFGPGAHGFDPGDGLFGARRWNAPGLEPWAERVRAGRIPPGGIEALSRDEALMESLFLALRRNAPFSPWALAERFSLPRARVASLLESLASHGDLEAASGATYRPTLSGMRRADGLALWLADRLSQP